MNKTGKIIIGAVIAVFVIAIAVGVVFAVKDLQRTKLSVPDEVDMEQFLEDEAASHANYYMSGSELIGQTNSVYLVFDNETGEFRYQTGTSTYLSGTYVQNGNEIVATVTDETSSSSDTTEMKFILDGDYIFFEDTIYDGDIDDIDEDGHFSAVCAHTSASGDVYRYTFRKDGTYSVAWGDPSDHNDTTVVDGEYSVDETGLISCSLNDSETMPMYVYKGHLVSTIYTALTDEEYAEQMQELEEAAAESDDSTTTDAATEETTEEVTEEATEEAAEETTEAAEAVTEEATEAAETTEEE